MRKNAGGVNFAKALTRSLIAKNYKRKHGSHRGESNGGVISGEKGDPFSTRGVEKAGAFIISEKKRKKNRRRRGIPEMLLDGKYPRLEGRFHPQCNAI